MLFGRIDYLVNNAGITRDTLILRMKEGRLGFRYRHEPQRRLELRQSSAAHNAQAGHRRIDSQHLVDQR